MALGRALLVGLQPRGGDVDETRLGTVEGVQRLAHVGVGLWVLDDRSLQPQPATAACNRWALSGLARPEYAARPSQEPGAASARPCIERG